MKNNGTMSMAAAKLEDQRRSQQYFSVPKYQPWDTGRPRQSVKDARKRYAKKRLTERGRNIAVGLIAACVVVGMVMISRHLHVAVQVAQQ